MQQPTTMPTRSGLKPLTPASSSASFAAPRAKSTLRSSRFTSFGCASPDVSKSLTSPAIFTSKPSVSNAWMWSMPLRPATAASHVERASFPRGDTTPIPVMATLFMSSIALDGAMAATVSPKLPFPPMEAELVDELPEPDGWQYEPKWDGFRGILENVTGELHLWSRNGRPLLRYFPELEALAKKLPPHSAVDGEIVIERDGALDFDALQMRLHPAESRVKKLSGEMPADFVAFDLLLWDGEAIHELPLEKRRQRVEKLPFSVSPATSDREVAEGWLDRLEVAGFDGVIAKRKGLPYLPGSREGVVKVKGEKTADCVVFGVTWSEKGSGIASIMRSSSGRGFGPR